jgi:type IV secretory pathway VirB10-like protein
VRQQRPSCLLVAALVLLVSIGLGACIVLLNPGRERPADVEPTPTLRVIVEPTRPVALPPPHTPLPPEPLLATPTSTPAPPTGTPLPTMTSTPVPTKKPPEEMRQRG